MLLRTRDAVYHAVGRSILLYGREAWPVQVADKRMLEVFDSNTIRCILRVRRCGAAFISLVYVHGSSKEGCYSCEVS